MFFLCSLRRHCSAGSLRLLQNACFLSRILLDNALGYPGGIYQPSWPKNTRWTHLDLEYHAAICTPCGLVENVLRSRPTEELRESRVKQEKSQYLSKPVARHFNLPGHSHEHMEIGGINVHLGNNETRKRKEQRLIFKLGTLAPIGINKIFSFI